MAAAASRPSLLLGAAVLLAWASAPRGAATLSEVVAETDEQEFVMSQDDECALGGGGGAADSSGAAACAMHAIQLRARPSGGRPAPLIGSGNAGPVHKDNSTVLPTSPMDLVVTNYDELKFAVDSLKTGGVIEVAKGSVITFEGTLNIDEGSSFKIWSHGATLDGKNAYGQVRLFYVRGQLTLLGFLIRNGKTDYAGALYYDFNSTGNITRCNFVDNQATYLGGAIAAKGANLQMTEVNFKDNKADNTCLSEHCSRRRRNDRAGNAVYIMSHTVLQAAIPKQQASQDFYFDKDFDGQAAFCGDKPALKATTPKATKEFVKTVNVDNGVCAF